MSNKSYPASYLAPYDDHSHPHLGVTVPQLTLFIIWLGALLVWLLRIVADNKSPFSSSSSSAASSGPAASAPSAVDDAPCQSTGVASTAVDGVANGDIEKNAVEQNDAEKTKIDGVVVSISPTAAEGLTQRRPAAAGGNAAPDAATNAVVAKNFSAVLPPPTLDEFLKQVVMLGGIMIYYYLCDYRKVFAMGERVYSRDTFLFLVFMLFLVGCFLTLRPTNDKILNRDHTEEWKGWMQVMFVWYHYFAAKEWYNWIRIYIACYVWMTGFGNFSFFWVRKDFSAWRAVKMLFRLDFLVLVICATVSNEYMVYYICAMHTYWFFSVYIVMGVFSSWNQNRWRMAAKLLVYAVFNSVIFDIPTAASYIFRPFVLILGLNDNPRDDLHEWTFRVGLDHWVCFIGMLCAYNYPYWESFIKFLEGDFNARRCLFGVGRGDVVKGFVVAVIGGIFALWYALILPLEKFTYNRVHPYTSWMPIVVYIVGRNMWPAMRTRYVHLFAWLGKVTLETYLSQLHIYLQSNAKHLVTYIPGYPLLNFSLSTIIYMSASYRLFHITTEFSAFLIPQDRKLMARNAGFSVAVLVMAAAAAWVLKLSKFV